MILSYTIKVFYKAAYAILLPVYMELFLRDFKLIFSGRGSIKYPITISEALDSLYLGIDKQAQAGLNILLVFHAQTE